MSFKRLLIVMSVIMLLLFGAVILGMCNAARKTDDTATPQPAELMVAEAPADSSAAPIASGGLDVRLILTGPQALQIGQAPQSAMLQVAGNQPLGELVVEVSTGAPNLRVMDIDNEAPGIQVAPAALPSGTEVVQSEVDANGVLRYRLRNLAASGVYTHNLVMLLLEGVTPGTTAIIVEGASATGPDGAALNVDTGPMLLVVVQDASASEPTPAPAPVSAAPPPASESRPGEIAPGIYYRIQRGQNLFRLAQAFGVTVEAIAQANGITDVRQIPTGMLLRIPAASPVGQASYLVGPGETLYSIARTFGMTVEQLAGLNAAAPPYQWQAGVYLLLRP